MYLKSIELQGFKAFPEKTTLSFKEGITVIIGPNGSGKSNIADAMRWVLGEVSSRNIRGTKMEDIIFGGAETRKPSGFAQVSLTLDNSGEEDKLPIIKLHDLRHTSATLLQASGCDIATISRRLGHSKVSVTLDVYSHAIPENDVEAADILSKVLSKQSAS